MFKLCFKPVKLKRVSIFIETLDYQLWELTGANRRPLRL